MATDREDLVPDLPPSVVACLFDLDGVLTRTATAHEAAWREMFDEFLSAGSGGSFRSFDHVDYEQYVDGKPRDDGTRAFLASRSITVPDGEADDPAGAPTVHGLGRRKHELFELGADPVARPIPRQPVEAPPTQPPGREPRQRKGELPR